MYKIKLFTFTNFKLFLRCCRGTNIYIYIYPYPLLVLVWEPSPNPWFLGHSSPAAVLPKGLSERWSGWTLWLPQKEHLQSPVAHWVTEEQNFKFLKIKIKKTLEDLLVYLTDNLIWRIFSNTHALHIPMYPVEPVQETQCLDKGLDWVDPD